MKTVAQLLKSKATQNQLVHTIAPDQMVLEALRVMAEKNVGALPVIENGQVVGVISERDYARKVVLLGRSSVGTPVSAIMSAPVVTVDSRQSVETCMGIMTHSHLRHLPVVENGELLGLLSIGDLVKEAIAAQADLIQQLEQYIRGEWTVGMTQAPQIHASHL
jgi:CBS domain-containing protein